jgi:hypothetical protein
VHTQSIPHTTPFWYFHYNPNLIEKPYDSMTLNLKPACPERCLLCAGAKTGRVNNGTQGTLSVEGSIERIFRQHIGAHNQLDSVAIVTGCFQEFNALAGHLREVQTAIKKFSTAKTFRVLEHNITTFEQYEIIVGELGYDIFLTLECFDNERRKIALNGNVGRKGRDSRQFIDMMKVYAHFLELHPELNKKFVRVTYLIGIDSLEVTELLFSEMAKINAQLRNTKVVPWLSVFTAYDNSMKPIQHKDFSLQFLLDAQNLAKKYFSEGDLLSESGSTADGYARGLF